MEENNNITEQEFNEFITDSLLSTFLIGAAKIKELIEVEQYENAQLVKQQVIDLIKSLPVIMGNDENSEISKEVTSNLISNFENIITYNNLKD